MPFIRNSPTQYGAKAMVRPEDELKQRQLGAAPSATAPAGTGAAPSAPGANTSAPGGNFTNLVDYVRANQGAAQGMADRVAGSIDRQAQGVTERADAAAAGKPMPRGGVGVGPGAPPPPAPGTPPVDRQTADLASAQAAQDKAKLAGTMGGRSELLNQQYGGQGYGQGENDLDNALMGSASGGRLEQLSQKYKGLTDYVRGKQQQVTDAAKAKVTTGQQPVEREPLPPPPGAAPAQTPMTDRSAGANEGRDPNTLSDSELNAQGYMYDQAPGESYAHFSDRVSARKDKKKLK
jgi:hypothetical protein